MKLLLICLALVAAIAANPDSVKIKKVITKFPKPNDLKVFEHFTFPKPAVVDIATRFLQGGDPRQLTAQVNEYTDILMKDIAGFIIESGMDPMQIPDIFESFEYSPILITYHGELNLTNGWLYDVATIHRGGDAILKYELGLLNLQIPLAFNDLVFNYNYHADIMDIGPTGTVDGKVTNVVIFLDLVMDLYNMEIVLQDFRIDHAGEITVNFHGNDLIDWLIELLVDVATAVLHDTVIGMVESQVYGGIESIVAGMNTMLQNIFTV